MQRPRSESRGAIRSVWPHRRFPWRIAGLVALALSSLQVFSSISDGILASPASPAGEAPVAVQRGAPRRLAFVHTHTAERLTIVYWQDGRYLPESLGEIRRFLRDWRTGDATWIDTDLLDLLHDLARLTGTRSPFQVICAYRTPQTNEMLRARGSGVATHSQHLRGRAIDVRLTDVPTNELRDAALSLGRGGVGYYASSDFVHLDTGPIRSW